MPEPDRILRMATVLDRTGLSRATLYRKIEAGTFPKLAHARRYCSERGWIVAREFVDAGASARDDKRPEFQMLMDAASVDPSPFDVVLVHSQSRFFRDAGGWTTSSSWASQTSFSRHPG